LPKLGCGYVLIVVFVILWVTAILLIYANPKTVWVWWACGYLLLNGCGAIAITISDKILPIVQNTCNSEIILITMTIEGIANSLVYNLSSYAFLIFVLYFTNFLDIDTNIITRHIFMAVLAIPGVAFFFIYPVTPFKPDYAVLSVYTVTYTLLAGLILVISIFKEKDGYRKNQKIRILIITIPTILTVSWTSYISVALGYEKLWYSNVWILVCAFSVFIFLAFKDGILGIKLRLEKPFNEETIDTVINGISTVSHAIKNEVSTINICVDVMRSTQEFDANTDKKLTIIKQSCWNLSDFAQRINKCRILEMDIKPVPLKVMIEKSVDQLLPAISQKQISIDNKNNLDIIVLMDEMHISEVLRNLLVNAVEAITGEGTIEIETELNKDNFCLSVTDSGIGIPREDTEKVLAPFYSTKKGRNNYGLGLSYCYKVMKGHNGSIKIESEVDQGTTMTLLFPSDAIQIYVGN
jgi:anti-sigma regulatory factor (Ser/Thr protein kinase)